MAPPSARHPEALLTGTGEVPFVATWMRRTVSISLYGLLWTLLVATLPLGLLAAFLVDVVRRRRWATLRTLAFFLLYLSCEVAGVVAAFWLWLTRGIWAGAQDPVYLERNFGLQCWWVQTLRRGAFTIYSLSVEIDGEELTAPGPMLFFLRHCSVADTMLPIMLVGAPHGIVLRWVMKQELLWDPCLDIVGNRLRNCFVSRTPEEGTRDVGAVATLMRDLGPKDGVALYPEGTRFTAGKRQRVIDKARERGDSTLLRRAESLQHTLPPRLGGALALLGHNAAGADALFCAHTGLEGFGTFWDLVDGVAIGNRVRITMWRVPFAEIPTTTTEQVAWLHEQWQRMDEVVTATQA